MKMNPTFDLLGQLLKLVLKLGEGEKAELFLCSCRKLKAFTLLWKSMVPKQKEAFRVKWLALGLPEELIKIN